MLHDVVEDCGATLDDIEEKFNRDIRDTVDSVSRRIYANGTKEKYADFILRSKQHPSGRVVKKADLLDNSSDERLMSLPESERGVIRRYRKALLVIDQD
jgi:(p)ppGpp synthase/HD superfamily hydrolase